MGAKVAALGGGHGLALALRSIREYADDITAIVSVADDGGSSGRLRRDLDIPAPGDLRRCLVALAGDENVWTRSFEHRFRAGELADHALGNLVLVGLAETLGSWPAALAEAGRLLGAVGRVVPATAEPVGITADVRGARVQGQVAVAIAGTRDRIRDVRLDPQDAAASEEAVAAIAGADQVVLAPGSLFTSIVAVVSVPEIRAALAAARGMVVQIANLEPENETTGLDGTDHLLAVRDHGGRVDIFLYDPAHGLRVDAEMVEAQGVRPEAVSIAAEDGQNHNPLQLAKALATLL